VVPVTDWKSDFGNLSWFVFLPAGSENGLSKESEDGKRDITE